MPCPARQALLVAPTMVLAAQHHARLCALVVALLHEAREGLWGQQGKGGYLEPLLLTGETKVGEHDSHGGGQMRITGDASMLVISIYSKHCKG